MSVAPAIVLVMLLAMASVGVLHARRVEGTQDFALAGRGLGAWALTGTLMATWIGTGSILGNAEFAYGTGIAGFLLPISGILGMLVLVRLAPRVRGRSASTVPELIGDAFGPATRRLGAAALIGAYLIIVSYQYRAGAAVAETLIGPLDAFGGSVSLWPVVGAAFVVLYTVLGGLASVAATDNVAGIVIIVGVLASVGIVFVGWDPSTEPLPTEHLEWGGGLGALGWVGVLLPSFLLLLGDANLMQRFMAADSERTARRAAWLTLGALLVVESAIIALALLGRARLGADLANPAHVVLVTAAELVPPVIGLALIAAIVAVVISTADSYLLAASTSVSLDLDGRAPTVARQRRHVLLLGVVALAFAYTSDAFFRVALFAYTIYGVTLTPAVVLALVRPRTAPRAILAGMAAGLGTALVVQFVLPWGLERALGTEGAARSVLAGLDPVLPALALNLLVLVVVELTGPRRRSATPPPRNLDRKSS